MSFQDQLDAAFPPATDPGVILAVRQGVLLADGTIESTPFLKSAIGQDIRGHLRRAGILFCLNEKVKSGELPFACTMSKMPRGNWHWIELRSGGFTSHVCRTEGPDLFPVDTATRQDDRLSNQGDLFRDSSNVIPLSGYMAWLTYGIGDSGELGHLCWAMPKREHDVWLARTNILRRSRQAEVVSPIETPERSTRLRFREHVEEALKAKSDLERDKPA